MGRDKEAVKEFEDATAKAAAEKAAASPPPSEDAPESDDQGGRKKKKRKRNDKKKTEKKSLFDESTVSTVQCDSTTSFELSLLFTRNVSCGGRGTYVRSLLRDIGYEMGTTCVTMTGLVRNKQGPYVLEDALRREDWSAEKIKC